MADQEALNLGQEWKGFPLVDTSTVFQMLQASEKQLKYPTQSFELNIGRKVLIASISTY